MNYGKHAFITNGIKSCCLPHSEFSGILTRFLAASVLLCCWAANTLACLRFNLFRMVCTRGTQFTKLLNSPSVKLTPFLVALKKGSFSSFASCSDSDEYSTFVSSMKNSRMLTQICPLNTSGLTNTGLLSSPVILINTFPSWMISFGTMMVLGAAALDDVAFEAMAIYYISKPARPAFLSSAVSLGPAPLHVSSWPIVLVLSWDGAEALKLWVSYSVVDEICFEPPPVRTQSIQPPSSSAFEIASCRGIMSVKSSINTALCSFSSIWYAFLDEYWYQARKKPVSNFCSIVVLHECGKLASSQPKHSRPASVWFITFSLITAFSEFFNSSMSPLFFFSRPHSRFIQHCRAFAQIPAVFKCSGPVMGVVYLNPHY